jgi:hypothetical protein
LHWIARMPLPAWSRIPANTSLGQQASAGQLLTGEVLVGDCWFDRFSQWSYPRSIDNTNKIHCYIQKHQQEHNQWVQKSLLRVLEIMKSYEKWDYANQTETQDEQEQVDKVKVEDEWVETKKHLEQWNHRREVVRQLRKTE